MPVARLFSVVAIVSALAVLSLGSATVRAADTYQVDPVHSMLLFRIKHFNVSNLYGRINNPTGTLVVDEADPSKSSVEIEVKPENVDTAIEKRDQHLKGPDFFNAKQFPTITFKSKSVKKADDANIEVAGDLTLLGVTKEITVKFARVGAGKDPMGGYRTGYEGTFSIKRSDYGMKNMLENVGDDVQLTVSVEGSRKL